MRALLDRQHHLLGGVFVLGWLGGGGWGREMSRPFWASGVTTMKMMSSTSITSMRGVMLMSAIAPDVAGWVASCEWTIQLRCLGAAGGGLGVAIALPLHLRLRRSGPLPPPPPRGRVHDLHDLRVGERLVRLQVDMSARPRAGPRAAPSPRGGAPPGCRACAAQVGGAVLLDRDDDASSARPCAPWCCRPWAARTSTPFCSIGVMTMKMIRSTIMMSAMGVTLMSAIGPPLLAADCH